MKMREIKFRAFDPDKKLFIFTGFNIMGECTLYDLIRDYSLKQTCDLKITQYTGLKDKNGIEIYEGDIVHYDKVCYDFDKEEGEEKYIRIIISEVIFEDGQFNSSQSLFRWEGEDLIDLRECVVIGNVFENIELLPK